MSRPGDIRSKTQKPHSAAGLATLSDRFHTAMAFEGNKPDSKDFSELDSPISPLRARGAASSNTSSSSSSSGSFSGKTPPNAAAAAAAAAKSDGAAAAVGDRRSHSGELSGSSDGSPNSADRRYPRPTHRRSGSGPLIYSGGSGSTANSPATNVLPAGNICPSGKIGKTGMMPRSTPRSDVLGSGTGNYGHGSIMRAGAVGSTGPGKQGGDAPAVGDSAVRGAIASTDPEEVTKAGNEHYKKGQFADALRLYDRAIMMCPGKAACRSNRAAALTGLGRLGEAVKECEEAIRLDPTYGRAHQRLASLHLRLGQVENARRHHNLAGQHSDPMESQKLQTVQRHLGRCDDARKIWDWKSALREADAAIAAGADSSPLLIAVRAEALLRLHRLNEADSTLSNSCKLSLSSSSTMQTKFFGMLSDSYVHVVRAQVEMALGRFENAVVEAEKAREFDPKNAEVMVILNNVRLVSRARARGNELFKSGNFADACMAYGEGLKYDPSNPVLHCNRAACFSKLEQVEKSVEDCNEALRIQPNYTKALLRRAASNAKLERWAESVRDYEVLRKELPSDTEVAEALFHAQVALKTSRGEEVSNMKFGGEVEEITGREQFQSAIALPGVSVVYFKDAMDQQCIKINPFVDSLCSRYPSLNFLKVNIKESQDVAKDESVVTVPTFKIYKNGARVKAMICPTQQVLEYSASSVISGSGSSPVTKKPKEGEVMVPDVSTMLRCGQNTIEVVMHIGPYNVIKNWNYNSRS